MFFILGSAPGCGPAFLVAQSPASPLSSEGQADLLDDLGDFDDLDELDLRIVCERMQTVGLRALEGAWSGPTRQEGRAQRRREGLGVKTYRSFSSGDQVSFGEMIDFRPGTECFLIGSRSLEGVEVNQVSYRHSVLTCSNRRESISGPQAAGLHKSNQFWFIPFSAMFSPGDEPQLDGGATQSLDLAVLSKDQKSWNVRVNFRLKRN